MFLYIPCSIINNYHCIFIRFTHWDFRNLHVLIRIDFVCSLGSVDAFDLVIGGHSHLQYHLKNCVLYVQLKLLSIRSKLSDIKFSSNKV